LYQANKNFMHKITSICKGGGYKYCRTSPLHPKANSKGLYPLHRVLAENKIGRYLLPNEIVHHKDEDKTNNKEENLEVLTNEEHSRLHAKTVELVDLVCSNCGDNFQLKPHAYRLRINRNKTKKIFCSRSCGGTV